MVATPLERHVRPRKTPRQTRAVETRARILGAARTVFARDGYAGGTTNRIADEASLSVGSLYQYFPNKDAILVELVNEHIDEGVAAVVAATTGVPPDDLETALRSVVRAMVDVHAADRRLHQVLFEESPRPPSLLTRLRDLEAVAVDAVAERLVSAGRAGPEARLRARVTVVAIESLVHRLVATDLPLDPEQVVDETTRLVHAYLTT